MNLESVEHVANVYAFCPYDLVDIDSFDALEDCLEVELGENFLNCLYTGQSLYANVSVWRDCSLDDFKAALCRAVESLGKESRQ